MALFLFAGAAQGADVVPAVGPYAGGNAVLVTNAPGIGNGSDITNVVVGTAKAPSITGQGVNWVAFVAPPASVEGVKNILIDSESLGVTTLANAYSYNPEGMIGPPAGWSKLSVGMNNTVYSLAGDGNELYAGGYFQTAGGVATTNLAVWNGSAWSNIPGLQNGQVYAVLRQGGNLYVGGDFTSVAGNTSAVSIAMWDGTAWTNLGIGMGGMNKSVRGLAHDGTNLYAVGSFTNAGGIAANRIAKWDGASWTNLGSGLTSGMYSPMAQGFCALWAGANLFVGGTFESAGGVNAGRIARWNGSAWVTMANGAYDYYGAEVNGIAHDGTNLYIGGRFTTVGGSVPATNVAKWNGSSWSAMGQGFDQRVQALGIADGVLYAGGQFGRSGTITNNRIAKWTGTAWTNVGVGVGGMVRAIATDGQTVYVGGDFSTAGGNSAGRIARWTPPESVDSGVEPGSGSWTGGYQVVISGSNLGDGSDITDVIVGGSSVASIDSQSATQVVVTLAPMSLHGTTAVQVVSTTFGVTTKSNVFMVTGPSLHAVGTDGQVIGAGAAPTIANGTIFQPLLPGQTNSHTFSLTNSGQDAVVITGFQISDGRFQVSGLPTNVSVGACSNFVVRFSPTNVGEVLADLVISNVAPVGVVTVKLSAAGCGVSTNEGPFTGGTTLTLTAGSFGNGSDITNVLVGGVAAVIVTQGVDWVTFITPSATNAGAVSVVVQSESQSERVCLGVFSYRGQARIEKWEWKWAWWPFGEGVNGKVMALHTIDGTNIFVGGEFTQAGGRDASNIARYNLETGVWTNLREGILGASVMALSSYLSTLYVGGDFDGAGTSYSLNIARWAGGTAWQRVSDGVSGPVHALHTIGSDIYFGGNFAYADDFTPSVTKFNGSYFPFFASPNMDGATYALAGNSANNLFAGGLFVRMGDGWYARRVAHYNGGVWTNLGAGLGGDEIGQTAVEALAYDGTTLYAGGDFINSGNSNIYYLAKWDGSSWSQVGGGMGGVVKTLVLTNGQLFVGGKFNRAGTNEFPYVAMWNGSVWTNYGGGVNGEVNKLLIIGSNIIAGGEFSEADGMPANNIAMWSYGRFETMGVEPREGSCTGGYEVVILGTNLMGDADAEPSVSLCGVPVASVVSYSPTQIVVVAAATTRGLLGDVKVISTTYGEAVRSNAFTYLGANLDIQGKENLPVPNGAAPSRDSGTDFMHRPLNTTNSQAFWIENDGTLPLTISGYGISDSRYQISNMPTSLVAEGGANFTVTFTPTTIGAFPSTLVITNDSAAGVFTVRLYGASAMLSTNVGPHTGGGSITISNGNFGNGTDITNVTVGGANAQITAQGATWVTITLPTGVLPGPKDIQIWSASLGNTWIVSAYRYNYPGVIDNAEPGPYVWTNIGVGLGGVWDGVTALLHDGTNLYAAGSFEKIGPQDQAGQPIGPEAKHIAMWNGYSWTNLGAGTYVKNYVSGYSDGTISALAHDGTYLYAAGCFDRAGEVDAVGVARWNGTAWKTLGAGLGPESAGGKTTDNYPYALARDGSNSLYVGGGFTNSGGKAMRALARWNGSALLAVSNGPYNSAFMGRTSVRELAHDGGSNLYVAGGFDYVGSTYTYGGLARLNGTNWQAMSWNNLYVGSIACNGTNVFLSGTMTNSIAQWYGLNNMSYPGNGLPFYTNRNQTISTLYGDGSNLYIGGNFINAGNVAGADGIAKWDGSIWTKLGSGTTQTIWAITSFSNEVYVGGRFDSIGGQPIKNIAKWYPAPVSSNAVLPYRASYTGRYEVVIRGSHLCNGDITAMTFCGLDVPLGDIISQTETQIVIRAPATTNRTLGHIWLNSVSFGETIKSNGFTYLYPGLKFLGTNLVSIPDGASATISNGNDFGHVIVGQTRMQRFRITNDGPVDLRIFNVATNGAGAHLFAVGAIPETIPTGGVVNVDITFAPTNIGLFEVQLVISNDTLPTLSNNAPFIVNLKGTSYERSHASGPFAGGNLLTITNMNFGTITNVYVGSSSSSATLLSSGSNWFTIIVPATGSSGLKDIIVQSSDIGDTLLAGAYTVNKPGEIIRYVDGPLGWRNIGAGFNSSVYSMLFVGTNLYAAGDFTNSGSTAITRVARWNGENWQPLGDGLNSLVKSIVYSGTNIYAAGSFYMSGSASVRYIARWNGLDWLPVGTGLFGGAADCMIEAGGNIYVGGTFTNAGGVTANRVAMWDGTAWTSLGTGLGGRVNALAHDGTNLYAGGSFTNLGSGVAANRIAKWDGTTWTALGSGLNDYVTSLFYDGTQLYVGGSFNQAGGMFAPYLARWDGASWAGVTLAINNYPYAYAYHDAKLQMGGNFSYVGLDTNTKYVAEWNGSDWVSFGSGMNSYVYDLEWNDGRLYAGGYFTNAGGWAANRIAVWGVTQIETNAVIPDSGSWTGGYEIVINGLNLGTGTDITNVTLCGVSATINSQSATRVWLTVNPAANQNIGLGDVRVFSASFGETVKSNAFFYDAPGLLVRGTNGATITSGAAASSTNGTLFPPTRLGLARTRTFSITNNGSEALALSGFGISDLRFQISDLPATVAVGSVSNFTVTYTPTAARNDTAALVISNDSPTTVYTVNLAGSCFVPSTNVGPFAGGNTITITNGYFGDITNVLVGPSSSSVTLISSGSNWFTITLPAATNAGSVNFTVQTSDNGDILLENAYTYNPQGVIVDVTPSSGSWTGGYPVVISGTNLGNGADITSVTLGGVAASLVSQSATQVVVTASVAASQDIGSGDVHVYSVSFGETVKSNAFTYTAPGLLVKGTNGAIIASGADASSTNGTIFPPTRLGLARTHTFSITNNGSEALALSGFGISDLRFQISHLPATVAVGSVSNFTVTYTPTAAGNDTAALVISNDSPTTAYTVNLAGSCFVPSTNLGPFVGGNTITVTNGYFGDITNVIVGSAGVAPAASGSNWFTISLPAATNAGSVTFTVQTSDNGDILLENAYTYNLAGSISSVSPASGFWTGLYEVVISGTNLGDGGDIYHVALSDVGVVGIPSQSPTQVVVVAGASNHGLLGDVRIYSMSFGETVASNAFQYLMPQFILKGTNGAVIADGDAATSTNGSDLGSIIVGQGTLSETFTITNSGNTTLHITGVSTSGSPSFVLQHSDGRRRFPAGWSIPPSSFIPIEVTFDPAGGRENATFTFTHDGTNSPFAFNVSGLGIGGGIHLDDNAKTFSATYQSNNPAVQLIGMTNVGVSGFTYTNVISYGNSASGWLSVNPSAGYLPQDGATRYTNLVSIAQLNAGTYTATVAVTSEDATNSPQEYVVTLVVDKASQAITVENPGTQFTTNATPISGVATSGLPVYFELVSGAASLSQTTSPATVTYTASGDVVIRALQPGNSNWYAASPTTQSFAVAKTPQAALHFTPATPQVFQTTNLLSTTGGSGTGGVSYAVQSGPGQIVSGNSLTITSGTGQVVLVATKATDDMYLATAATAIVVCAKANQTITFDPIADQFWTNVLALTATASSPLDVSYEVLSGPAVLSLTSLVSFTGYGEVAIRAYQVGDDNYHAAPSVTNTFQALGPILVMLGTNGAAIAGGNAVETANGTDFGEAIIGVDVLTNVFTLTNSGNATLTISSIATNGSSSFTLHPFPSVLSASSAVQVLVAFDPQTGGSNAASFTFVCDGTNSPYVLNVGGFGLGGGIAFETNELRFAANFEGLNPASQLLTMTNVGMSGYTWTSAVSEPWLTISPTNGYVVLDGSVVLSNAVDISGLDFGTYTALVTIAAFDATNTPQHYTVTLMVDKYPGMANPTFSNVMSTTAMLGAEVTTTNYSHVIERGIAWATTSGFAFSNATLVSETGAFAEGAYSLLATNLPAGTVIYFRGWATNSAGINWTAETNFLTRPPAPVMNMSSNIIMLDFEAWWQAAQSATGYWMEASYDDPAFGPANHVPGYSNRRLGDVLTESVTNLVKMSTSVYVRVAAENATGIGPWSEPMETRMKQAYTNISAGLSIQMVRSWTNKQEGLVYVDFTLCNSTGAMSMLAQPFHLSAPSNQMYYLARPDGTAPNGDTFVDVTGQFNASLGGLMMMPGDCVTVTNIPFYFRFMQPQQVQATLWASQRGSWLAPVVADQRIRMKFGTTNYVGQLSLANEARPPVTFEAQELPLHGEINIDLSGVYTYTPDMGYSGRDQFVFRAANLDGIGTGRVDVVIWRGNMQPVLYLLLGEGE